MSGADMDWVAGANQSRKRAKRRANKVDVKRPERSGQRKREAQGRGLDFAECSDIVKRAEQLKKDIEPISRRANRDPIENLKSKGELTWPQGQAAHVIREAFRKLGIDPSSIDPRRIRVDCASAGDPELRMLEAKETLQRVHGCLDRTEANIVVRAAGFEEGIFSIALDYVTKAEHAANGAADRASKGYVIRSLQNGLDKVASEFGFQDEKGRPRDYLAELLGD